jgi:uncharacterized protein
LKGFAIKKSAIHNVGVFTNKDIAKGARFIEYVGEKITMKEAGLRVDPSGAIYIFELNARYCIDGNVSYNTARHINHSCDPNSKTDVIGGKIWIIALRDIKAGEEITYNYGYDFSDEYETHPCRCGSKKCVGFILHKDLWPRLREVLETYN